MTVDHDDIASDAGEVGLDETSLVSDAAHHDTNCASLAPIDVITMSLLRSRYAMPYGRPVNQPSGMLRYFATRRGA